MPRVVSLGVRNVNGLPCKACHLGLGVTATVEQDKKTFSLPQLATHLCVSKEAIEIAVGPQSQNDTLEYQPAHRR